MLNDFLKSSFSYVGDEDNWSFPYESDELFCKKMAITARYIAKYLDVRPVIEHTEEEEMSPSSAVGILYYGIVAECEKVPLTYDDAAHTMSMLVDLTNAIKRGEVKWRD